MAQLVVNGLAMGSIYALVALGLLMIFNTVKIVNFAQGQLLMVGAFIGITGAVQHALPVVSRGLSPSSPWRCSASCSCWCATFRSAASLRSSPS